MIRVVLYASICDKGHFGNKVKRGCRTAAPDRSYDRLEIQILAPSVSALKISDWIFDRPKG